MNCSPNLLHSVMTKEEGFSDDVARLVNSFPKFHSSVLSEIDALIDFLEISAAEYSITSEGGKRKREPTIESLKVPVQYATCPSLVSLSLSLSLSLCLSLSLLNPSLPSPLQSHTFS